MNRILLIVCICLLPVVGAYGQSITGTLNVCTGNSTTLAGTPAGGTWSSSNPAIAPVSTSGVVTGVSAGVAAITYDIGTGIAVASVTVNATPAPVSGPSSVCVGQYIILYDTTPGGIWSSSSPAVATVNASGMVTGIAAGGTQISYIVPTGCYAIKSVLVNNIPSPIFGASALCVGASATLGSATTGGSWYSSTSSVAIVGTSTGVVTGISPGATTISYVLPSTGCFTTRPLTVNPNPSAITGVLSVCPGTTTALASATTGGTWSSSNIAVASVDMTSGVVTGTSAGIATISYALGTGCHASAVVTVNPLPVVTGSTTVCTGNTSTLSAGCGTWGGTSPAATITAGGMVTGVSTGTATFTFTSCAGCMVTTIVTVNGTPVLAGPAIVCAGTTATLTSSVTGGTWVSSNAAVAGVGAFTGIVSGYAAGAATISYTTAAGCLGTKSITVSVIPMAGPISGITSVCTGTSALLTSPTAGGTWTSSSASIVVVGAASGIITGVSAGTAMISYTVSNSCGTNIATTIVSVNPSSSITGVSPACIGLTATLSGSTGCGTWSSGAATVATVAPLSSGTALVTGISAGTAMITFTPCAGCVSTMIVTINSAPAPIIGASRVCMGTNLALDNATPGGVWSSSNAAVATITTMGSTPGVVTGVSTGVVTMTYALSAGCIATLTMTVVPLPVITASAASAPCGGTYMATAAGGVTYTWSPATGVSCTSCATTAILPYASVIYTVTGTDSAGCSNTATVSVSGNRIFGHVSFSSAYPATPASKVWLIQYDPADSSLTAVDSMLTCDDGGLPYYQFNGKPTGSYMVKAKLLSSIPGTGDYIPTYGSATPYWNAAASISHVASADSQHITLLYGTVLSGPGFISGYVYAGAGKGTAGELPVAGMLVFLKNPVTGVVLNYTYTNASGAYSFSGLSFGNYVIYPEEFSYYTTPSSVINIGPGAESSAANFKKHTDYGTITPFDITTIGVAVTTGNNNIFIYPNPSNGLVTISLGNVSSGKVHVAVTDVTGAVVYRADLDADTAGHAVIDLAGVAGGVYFVSVTTNSLSYYGKLMIQE
ncbi:MAG: T9SS type A sorting domain-containing protein [Bacteroidota bacterium]